MARVTYGAQVTAYKGSIGGTTFQQNRSGSIVRSKPKIGNIRSSLQSGSRQKFSGLSASWGSISGNKKINWNEFADTYDFIDYYGNTKKISGYNWFLHCNRNLLTIGESIIDDPPSHVVPSAPDFVDCTANPGVFEVIFNVTTPLAGEAILIFASYPVRTSSLLNRASFRYISQVLTATSTEYDITSEYESAFDIDTSVFLYDCRYFVLFSVCAINKTTGISSVFSQQIFGHR